MRVLSLLGFLNAVLLFAGCPPASEPTVLAKESTVVWPISKNQDGPIETRVIEPDQENTVVLDVKSREQLEQNKKAFDQHLGARFQFPAKYHPIHNHVVGEIAMPALNPFLADQAVGLVVQLEHIAEKFSEKNIMVDLGGWNDDFFNDSTRTKMQFSGFTDLVFFESKQDVFNEQLGTREILAKLGKIAGCGEASAVLLTPKGAKKIIHLLMPVHEDPALQLSRYLGLNLRTVCVPSSDDEPFYAKPATNPVTMEEGIDLDRDVNTYVLNLDRSPQRLKHMAQTLKNANVAFERFSAIDGKAKSFDLQYLIDMGEVSGWFDSNLPYHPIHQMGPNVDLNADEFFGTKSSHVEIKFECNNKGYDCIKNKLGLGTIATGLSHVKMIESHFEKHPQTHGLFFEDDVSIPPSFKDDFNKALSELPSEWDIIYLDYHDSDCVKKDVSKYLGQYAELRTCVPGDFAMLVNYKSAKKIVALMTPLYEESDRQLMKYFGTAVNAYWTKVPLVKVDLGSPSDRKMTDNSTVGKK